MTASPLTPALPSTKTAGSVLPGLMLCAVVGGAAAGLAEIERAVFGHAWLEPLVLAILLGAGVRTAWTPGEIWRPGVSFGARTLLEAAVVLLGASVSAAILASLGLPFMAGIVAVVAVAIVAGAAIGRALGLSPRMALLVACGNAICGNSAIAAVAPAIGAEGEEVTASIAFTAVLGVAVVLLLPLLGTLAQMTPLQFGALAGLGVYAVPQVLAAAAPFGPVAVQTGALVKLARVLTLGPVVFILSLMNRRTTGDGANMPLHRMVPWFILGFIVMVALRSAGLIPVQALAPIGGLTQVLTVLAMAGLGLQTDIRAVAKSGGRAVLAEVLSLAVLLGLALLLIRLLAL